MFKNILVPVDGSATADEGLRHAVALAGREGAALTLLHVVNVQAAVAHMQMATESLYRQHLQALRAQGGAVLDRAATAAAAAGVAARCVLREIEVAHVADAICAEAARGFDLIVIGTHGRRGWRRLMLGSDAELVLRTAPVPVLLVRREASADADAA